MKGSATKKGLLCAVTLIVMEGELESPFVQLLLS
jgi:hypothetical protein